MNEFFISWAVTTVLTLLEIVIKNPNSKEQYRKQFRKIVQKILLAYPEFKEDN
jgi:hypothetical protein